MKSISVGEGSDDLSSMKGDTESSKLGTWLLLYHADLVWSQQPLELGAGQPGLPPSPCGQSISIWCMTKVHD